MKLALLAGIFVFAGCRAKSDGSMGDAQAVIRIESDREFVIQAQKPDDITMKDLAERGLFGLSVRVRLADGKNGKFAIFRNAEVSLLSVRQALADGALAAVTGQAIRETLVIPKVNGKTHPDVTQAKTEGWRIDQIRIDSESVAVVEGVKIYCPWKIVFKKNDGSPKIVEFSRRTDCQSLLGLLGANVTLEP